MDIVDLTNLAQKKNCARTVNLAVKVHEQIIEFSLFEG